MICLCLIGRTSHHWDVGKRTLDWKPKDLVWNFGFAMTMLDKSLKLSQLHIFCQSRENNGIRDFWDYVWGNVFESTKCLIKKGP